MAAIQQQPNIWAQMSYIPPRGACSQKTSLVTTCSCYRFMIHPLKAATSFDCDGCGHHASFHRMENKEEEEVARRWKEQQEHRVERNGNGEGFVRVEELEWDAKPKRRRIGEKPQGVVEVLDGEGERMERVIGVGRKRKGRGG